MAGEMTITLKGKDIDRALKSDFSPFFLNEMIKKKKTHGIKQINLIKKIQHIMKGGFR